MRKLILNMTMSINGFVGGKNGAMGKIIPHDKGRNAWQLKKIWQAGLFIMGHRSFLDMITAWPTSKEPLSGTFAEAMNAIPKAYFSRGKNGTSKTVLEDAKRIHPDFKPEDAPEAAIKGWVEAPMLTGDLAEEIKTLKAQDGKPIVSFGGAGFARSLIATRLIDEFHFTVNPIALGEGLPIFTELSEPLELKLVELERFPSGILAKVLEAV